jgi:GMP synthase PP-ATPase subunit
MLAWHVLVHLGRLIERWAAAERVTTVLAYAQRPPTDRMTADFYPFDMKFPGSIATRIINEVKGMKRVVFDVTSKPPGTIEWE